ncbi:MAG: LD-carboxypeptidase [Bacteroidetes bacterium]|uniref:LD-carboxypeptidase n=1 Tax=Candidatus Gallipaludibacter merdavium TaxID=2840839 RepID=A0A9D9N426_9BACT|nr:LD-carboxypeptidase [Candidatus Gallipaludibacter merdavium]
MRIHIISPSGAIDPTYIHKAAARLSHHGHQVSIAPHACGQYGRFSGTPEERIADLQQAIDSPNIDAILCSRGGYGLVQIIDKINFSSLKMHPKLFIGFSDITVLHNALGHFSIPSVHGIMCKHITELAEEAAPLRIMLSILNDEQANKYYIKPHSLNRNGLCSGIVRGGNLSVLYGLRHTPFDLPDTDDTILFIEDIAERPYHIDRMMNNLRLSGTLARLKGLIVGQFSDCPDDPLMMKDIAHIIHDHVDKYNYPVCFDFPAGHVEYNLPIWLNRKASMRVDHEGCCLHYDEI